MPQTQKEMIEDIITRFSGKTFSDHEDAMEWWRKALAEVWEGGRQSVLNELKEETNYIHNLFSW